MYQTSSGGKTYIPLESGHSFFGSATPRLAKMIGWKYAHLAGSGVISDFAENHQRPLSKTLVQDVAERVGELISEHESEWTYNLPDSINPKDVALISVGRDGTCMPMLPKGWREAMCGTISLFDSKGERLHTIYQACTPEYGKKTFDYLLTHDIKRIKKMFPNAQTVGVADGAGDNWTFLRKHVRQCILDFYHATTYLSKVAEKLPDLNKKQKKKWLDEKCHQLKNDKDAAKRIYKEVKELKNKDGIPMSHNENVKSMLTYFNNHLDMMDYTDYQSQKFPIGSGVTEAACKIIVKQRLGLSGMRWSINGTNTLLILRTLCLTEGRWNQAWSKITTLN